MKELFRDDEHFEGDVILSVEPMDNGWSELELYIINEDIPFYWTLQINTNGMDMDEILEEVKKDEYIDIGGSETI